MESIKSESRFVLRVVDEISGQGLNNVAAKVIYTDGSNVEEVSNYNGGSHELAVTGEGPWRLELLLDEYVPLRSDISRYTSKVLHLELKPYCRLKGRVRFESGGVPSGKVSLTRSTSFAEAIYLVEEPLHSITELSIDGGFVFEKVIYGAAYSIAFPWQVNSGATTKILIDQKIVDLGLIIEDDLLEWTIRVFSPEGSTASKARCAILREDGTQYVVGETNDIGIFTCFVAPGDHYTISVRWNECVYRSEQPELPPQANETLVHLQYGSRIAGHVTDSFGNIPQGIVLVATLRDSEGRRVERRRVLISESGEFNIDGLRQGELVELLAVSKSGHMPKSTKVYAPNETVKLVIASASKVSVRIMDKQTGEDVEMGNVRTTPFISGLNPRWRANSDGMVELPDYESMVPDGVMVTLFAEGYFEHTLAAGSLVDGATVALRPTPTATFSLTSPIPLGTGSMLIITYSENSNKVEKHQRITTRSLASLPGNVKNNFSVTIPWYGAGKYEFALRDESLSNNKLEAVATATREYSSYPGETEELCLELR